MKFSPKEKDASRRSTAYAQHLNEAVERDSGGFLTALGEVARAEGMKKVATVTGLSRESLYRALSRTGNPEFSTLKKVFDCLGLRMSFSPELNFKPLPYGEGEGDSE